MRSAFLAVIFLPCARPTFFSALTYLYVIVATSISPSRTVSAQSIPQAASGQVVQRDAAGIAAISKALTGMGGEAAYAAIKDTSAASTCIRVTKTESTSHIVRSVTAGDYFRYDGGETNPNGLVNGPSGAARIVDGKATAMEGRSVRAVRPLHIPGLMLYWASNNPANEIRMLDSVAINGVTAVHVRVIDARTRQDSPEPEDDWYFDPQTGLPIKLAYSTPALNSVRRRGRSTVEYSNYAATNGLNLPNAVKRTLEGGPTTTCTMNSFAENTNPDPSFFSITNGGGK